VLFQIQIFYTLVQSVQYLGTFIIFGILLRSGFFADMYYIDDFNPFEMWEITTSPVAYILVAAVFVMTLLGVIFFYKKNLKFRVFFILGTAVNISALCAFVYYMLSWINGSFSGMFGEAAPFTGVFGVFYAVFAILPTVGIAVAFIIALYKSQRVKNTFS